jgi:hypothetical protein
MHNHEISQQLHDQGDHSLFVLLERVMDSVQQGCPYYRQVRLIGKSASSLVSAN